jgi:hypothetical protein
LHHGGAEDTERSGRIREVGDWRLLGEADHTRGVVVDFAELANREVGIIIKAE